MNNILFYQLLSYFPLSYIRSFPKASYISAKDIDRDFPQDLIKRFLSRLLTFAEMLRKMHYAKKELI